MSNIKELGKLENIHCGKVIVCCRIKYVVKYSRILALWNGREGRKERR